MKSVATGSAKRDWGRKSELEIQLVTIVIVLTFKVNNPVNTGYSYIIIKVPVYCSWLPTGRSDVGAWPSTGSHCIASNPVTLFSCQLTLN